MRPFLLLLISLAFFWPDEGRAKITLSLAEPRLSWAPPVIDANPVHIEIQKSPGAGSNRMIITRPNESSPLIQDIPQEQTIRVEMQPEDDVILSLPQNDILKTAGIVIVNGHSVRIIGGHLQATGDANKKNRALLRVAGQSGTVYVEGVILDQNNKKGLDGFEFGGLKHLPGRKADIFIQNSACLNGGPALGNLHSDCIQPYGPTKAVHLDKIKIRSQYQGFFLDPQHDHTSFDLKRIDTDYSDPAARNTGYACYLHSTSPALTPPDRRPSFSLEHVYCGSRNTYYRARQDGWWSWFAVYPPASKSWGAKPDRPEPYTQKVTFPSYPEIKGGLLKGPPPVDIVDEKKIGLNYKTPGYME